MLTPEDMIEQAVPLGHIAGIAIAGLMLWNTWQLKTHTEYLNDIKDIVKGSYKEIPLHNNQKVDGDIQPTDNRNIMGNIMEINRALGRIEGRLGIQFPATPIAFPRTVKQANNVDQGLEIATRNEVWHLEMYMFAIMESGLANERTFLAWLSMAVTIGSVSAALVGFTASENDGRVSGAITQNTTNLITVLLLPVAILMIAYALTTFYARSVYLQRKQMGFYLDWIGPTILCSLVMIVLLTITIVAFWDVMVY